MEHNEIRGAESHVANSSKTETPLEEVEITCDACGAGSYLESHPEALIAVNQEVRQVLEGLKAKQTVQSFGAGSQKNYLVWVEHIDSLLERYK